MSCDFFSAMLSSVPCFFLENSRIQSWLSPASTINHIQSHHDAEGTIHSVAYCYLWAIGHCQGRISAGSVSRTELLSFARVRSWKVCNHQQCTGTPPSSEDGDSTLKVNMWGMQRECSGSLYNQWWVYSSSTMLTLFATPPTSKCTTPSSMPSRSMVTPCNLGSSTSWHHGGVMCLAWTARHSPGK